MSLTVSIRLIVIFIFVFLANFQMAVYAQLPSTSCPEMPKEFLELADLRGQLKIDIGNLEQSIKELPAKIEGARTSENDLRDAEAQIKKLQDKPTKTAADEQQIDSLEKLRASIQKLLAGNSAGSYQAQLDQKKTELDQKMQLLRCAEKSIAGIFSPEQSFKTWMSFAFAFLILVVIVGFFVLSYKDERIRQAIFSGQAGMQFLTLFSLVIAIILFGITGILEDKELAALLGGLSGYILGRNTSPGPQTSSLRVAAQDRNTDSENGATGNDAETNNQSTAGGGSAQTGTNVAERTKVDDTSEENDTKGTSIEVESKTEKG